MIDAGSAELRQLHKFQSILQDARIEVWADCYGVMVEVEVIQQNSIAVSPGNV